MNAKTKGARILMVFIMIYLLIPLVVTIIYSLFKKWTGILPEQFSLDSYVTIFKDPEFLVCIARTIFLCIIPIIVTTIIILLALFVTTVCFPQLEKWIS